jgi:hypothetical protein
MSAALYAIAGTIVGVLGTALVDALRSRRDDRGRSKEALRTVASDFTAQVARVRRYSIGCADQPEAYDTVWPRIEAAFAEARAYYERLRITSESMAVQEAARYVIHFTYGMTRLVRKNRTIFDEANLSMLTWSLTLYNQPPLTEAAYPGNPSRDRPRRRA